MDVMKIGGVFVLVAASLYFWSLRKILRLLCDMTEFWKKFLTLISHLTKRLIISSIQL
jgi:hypothetical protein